MNGPEHYAMAEKWLDTVDRMRPAQDQTAGLAAATHALLALTAATVDSSEEINSMAGVFGKWSEVGATGWDA